MLKDHCVCVLYAPQGGDLGGSGSCNKRCETVLSHSQK